MDNNFNYNNNGSPVPPQAPQYPPQGFYPPQSFNSTSQLYVEQSAEKKSIRLIGIITGICIILYVVLENIIVLGFTISPSVYSIYKSSPVIQNALMIVLSITALLLPFAAGGKYLAKKTGTCVFPLDKPQSIRNAVLLVLIGFGLCAAADYFSSWIVYFFDILGFKLIQPDTTAPDGILARIVYLVAIGFVAPLCEEVAIRGSVMQPLRKYGDTFAIVISSLVFGILHGNLVQAPFAFIAGLGLGYAAIISGSLWTSICIHMLNNVYACITYFVSSDYSPEQYESFYYITMGAVAIAGGLSALGFAFVKGRNKLSKSSTKLTAGPKTAAFFINPSMIIALIIMLFITAQFVSYVK